MPRIRNTLISVALVMMAACKTGHGLLGEPNTGDLGPDDTPPIDQASGAWGLVFASDNRGVLQVQNEGTSSRVAKVTLNAPRDIALDQTRQQLYWIDASTRKIQRAERDGSQVQEIVTDSTLHPYAIAVAEAAARLFWTDRVNNTLHSSTLDGDDIKTVIDSNLEAPSGLVVDESRGKIVWANSEQSMVEEADYDGANRQTLLQTTGLISSIALAYNTNTSLAEWLYYANNTQRTIERVAFGATQQEVIASNIANVGDLNIDPTTQRLVWTIANQGAIFTAALDGTGITLLGTTGLQTLQGFDIDSTMQQLYLGDAATHRIAKVSLQSGAINPIVAPNMVKPVGIAVSKQDNLVFWTDPQKNRLFRSAPDGTGLTELPITGLSGPGAVRVNHQQKMLYWVESSGLRLMRSRYDGSELQTVADLSSLALAPSGLALDNKRQRIYVSDSDSSTIFRTSLEGDNLAVLLSTAPCNPQAIAIDDNEDLLFAACANTQAIIRIEIETNTVTTLLSTQSAPTSLAMDTVNNRLLWNENGRAVLNITTLQGEANTKTFMLDMPLNGIGWAAQ